MNLTRISRRNYKFYIPTQTVQMTKVLVPGKLCHCGAEITVICWGGHLTPMMKRVKECQLCRDRTQLKKKG